MPLTRLEDNEAMLDWSGMVFHGSRLKFEVNRVCGVRRRKMEAELRFLQQKEDAEEFSGPENLPDDDEREKHVAEGCDPLVLPPQDDRRDEEGGGRQQAAEGCDPLAL